jgi:hypothetical protein
VTARAVTWLILAATVAQLAVATFIPGLDQFEGKAFGARLLAYPLLMLAPPAVWWLTARRSTNVPRPSPPWTAFALIMAPFLVDVTGNTLDLYDSIGWWDEANHFANWVLLCAGFGVLMTRAAIPSRWVFVLAVTGVGALLAIGWELGEWFTFIRHGTELDTAYEDTLSDEALGTLGGLVAALLVTWRTRTPSTDPA